MDYSYRHLDYSYEPLFIIKAYRSTLGYGCA